MTADKYELPLIVADRAKDVAEYVGISEITVKTQIHRGMSGIKTRYKLLRVPIGEDDEMDIYNSDSAYRHI